MLDKLVLTDFERTRFDELIELLESKPSILRDFLLKLSLEKSRAINFARACELLVESIKSYCALKARKYKINSKSLSQYEEDYLLTKYCFVREFGFLPSYLKKMY